MKKELFNETVKLLTANCLKSHLTTVPVIKYTETDEIIAYHFPTTFPKDIDEQMNKARAVFKEFGYKGEDVYDRISAIAGSRNNILKTNLSILYSKVKDRISISSFEVGFRWADRKGRFFPSAKNNPIFCYSSKLYTFCFGKPRLMKGISMGIEGSSEIMKLVLGIDFNPTLQVLTKYYVGAKNDWDVLFNRHGIRVPKALQVFDLHDIDILYSVLANKGEVNRICQYLATRPVEKEDSLVYGQPLLFHIIAEMMGITDSWIVRDWVNDHYALKKTLSLKITSINRIRDEHRKLSRLRMYKGIKDIKVASKYNELFKNSEINAELITDKKRLLQESIDQDHCVATYADQINSGSCAIFSIVSDHIRYTLQVSSGFMNAQFRGYGNCIPPAGIFKDVNDYLESYRNTIANVENNKVYATVEDNLPF